MTQTHSFSLTDNAIKRLKILMASEKEHAYFRVSVLGGGCSGFQYKFEFDQHKNADDQSFEYEGITVLVDETSIQFLEGAQLDYVEELIGSSFKIINPNASSSCGCGSSFSV